MRDVILTLEEYHARRDMPVDRTWLAAKSPGVGFDRTPPSGAVAGVTILARVEFGRWIVDCPWCGGAELGSHADHLFFCCGCRNKTVGHAYARVEFPKHRVGLERVLLDLPENARHWRPGQTVGDVRVFARAVA